MNLRIGVRTDVGRVREGNEDSYLVREPLFVVADGMGGHVAGDVASSTAVDAIGSETAVADGLAALVKKANAAIHEQALADPSLQGMGTTCTLLFVDDSTAHLAHVGDSRAYLLREGELRQLTEDHTLVARWVKEGRLGAEEAAHHPQRNVITRVLGVDDDVQVDTMDLELAEGDRLLLASDGLTSMVEEDDIAAVLTSESDPQTAADELVERANAAGGEDNVTVLIVDVDGAGNPPSPAPAPAAREETEPRAPEPTPEPEAPPPPPKPVRATPRRWRRRLVWAVLAVLLLAGAGYGAARFALANTWFVGVTGGGDVAIYRGIPDDIAGLTLREVEEETSLELSDLPEFKHQDLREGIRVDSLAEGEQTIDDLEQLARAFNRQDERKRNNNK